MIQSIIGLLLVLLALAALALQRLYSSVPARELKRLAGRDDELARVLYRPVAYGGSLRLFLWIVTIAKLSLRPSAPSKRAGSGCSGRCGACRACSCSSYCAFSASDSAHRAFCGRTGSNGRCCPWLPRAGAWPLEPLMQQRRQLNKHSGIYEKEDIDALLGSAD